MATAPVIYVRDVDQDLKSRVAAFARQHDLTEAEAARVIMRAGLDAVSKPKKSGGRATARPAAIDPPVNLHTSQE